MGNTSELLINVVSITVPNLLIGINQKKVMRPVVLVKGRNTSSHKVAGE